MRHVFLFFCLTDLALAACSGSSVTAVDAQPGDRGPQDRPLPVDAPGDDLADGSSRDLAGGEVLLLDLGRPDAGPGCSYVVVDEVLVQCGANYIYVEKHFLSSGPSACAAEYWAIAGLGGQHPNPTTAALAAGCSAHCIWSKAVGVTLLHCGQKTGYIRFDAPGCTSLYQFPEGYYPSFAAWELMHPCLDAGVSG